MEDTPASFLRFTRLRFLKMLHSDLDFSTDHEFSNVLRAAINTCGLTGADIARELAQSEVFSSRVSVNKVMMSRWIRRNRLPSPSNRLVVIQVLRDHIAALVEE